MNPITFNPRYQVEHSRLTTFFRLIIVIPWMLWSMLYGLAAFVVTIIAWFAMMFTGRYPAGMYDFVAGYLRLSSRILAYALLLTDELPSFGAGPEPDYAVRVDVAQPQADYNRAKTFFKLVLYFPQGLIASYGLVMVAYSASFISWWRIVFTGKQSITMHEALVTALAYIVRSNGFLLLLTEAHPRMLDVPRYDPPADAPGMPGPEIPAPVEPA